MSARLVLLCFCFCFCFAALTACGDGDAVRVPFDDSRVSVFERHVARVQSGVVDLTDAAQAPMAVSGWVLPSDDAPRPKWIWSDAPESVVWIALAEGQPVDGMLTLEVRAPEFIPEPFSLRVELNHVVLGSVALGPGVERVSLPLPENFESLPMNRLALRGSHWSSPEELGTGSDSRRLSFSFRLARLSTPGAELLVRRLRPPRGAFLEAEQSPSVSVFDLAEGTTVLSQAALSARTSIRPTYPGSEVAIVSRSENTPAAAPVVPKVSMGASSGYPSIVLIVVDTLRADAVGLVPTPNIDRLIREGVQFDSAFANAPMTLPSHTALFSSRLPSTSGVVNNGQSIPSELPLLPELLHDQGYATLGVVSIGALWFAAPQASLARGFADYLSAGPLLPTGSETAELLASRIRSGALDGPFLLFAHFADPHFPYRDQVPKSSPVELELDGKAIWSFHPSSSELFTAQLDLPKGEHTLTWSSPSVDVGPLDLRLSALGTPLETTFVKGGLWQFGSELEIRFTVPEEGPIDIRLWPADNPLGEQRVLRYAGGVMAADEAIGELIAELDRAGVWDDSLVIFTSDHGEAFSEHGYNGHVEHLFDEMLHVPLVIRPPLDPAWDGVRALLRERRHGLFPLTDLAPTILDMLHREPLPGSEGSSLLTTDRGETLLFAETHTPEAARDLYCVRDARWKLIFAPEEGAFELFDLESDPGERVDLYADAGAQFADWREQLTRRARLFEATDSLEIDAEMRRDLEALGY